MLSCRDPPAGRIKALLHVPVREWTQAWKHAECIHSANAGGSSGITEENFQVVKSWQTEYSLRSVRCKLKSKVSQESQVQLLNYKSKAGTSLVVQWLSLHIPSAGDPGSIPGPGIRSRMPQLRPHAAK